MTGGGLRFPQQVLSPLYPLLSFLCPTDEPEEGAPL